MKGIIDDVRASRIHPDKESALYEMAFHKDLYDRPLTPEMAAIELINVIRPIVAISTFIAFAALALHMWPDNKQKLLSDSAFFERSHRKSEDFTHLGPSWVPE